MAANYDGLTRNTWPGTWSPATTAPIALDTELRGTLQSITGLSGDQLTNIPGQRIQEGMLVYVKNEYVSGSYTRTGDRYYTYKLQSGEVRSTSTGAVPNAEINWSEVTFGSSGSSGSTYTLPVASSTTLGGVKIGSGLEINNGVVNVTGTTTSAPIRRATAQLWTDVNPILGDGELAFEIDTATFKLGDGILHWNDLPYVSGEKGDQGIPGNQINKVIDIPDVNSTGLLDGSLLVYNEITSKWDVQSSLLNQNMDGGEF